VTEKSVYEVKFDDMGTLASIEQVEHDGVDVPLVRRKTPTAGHDLTFAQQLLGQPRPLQQIRWVQPAGCRR